MNLSNSQTKIIPLKKKRSLVASYSLAKTKTKNWIVFLLESSAEFRQGHRQELESLVGTKVSRKFNFLVINKPGLTAEGLDKEEFEKSFRREKRIEDALQALQVVIPKGHHIHLVGYSEGAYLAPQVAQKDKRIKTVSMIGGGTRGWLKEELNTASVQEKKVLKKKIKEIYRTPRAKKKWNGFSYATWYSYRGDNTLKALRDLHRPTLAILGARDRVIDLKSAIVDLVLISERQPTHIHIFGDCGHDFKKHWKQVKQVLGRFLQENIQR